MSSCDSTHTYAPVTDISGNDPVPISGKHQVVAGETLYEIAWRYGLDYRTLAIANQIEEPYAIHPGQMIILDEKGFIKERPSTTLKSTMVANRNRMMSEQPMFVPRSGRQWIRPANRKIDTLFARTHNGINISGKMGDPIYAAAGGRVVYAGNGLRGYGNLIILKHNNVYLSAYAHNRVLLVREGELVTQGQKIAEMGNTGANKVMLHFEIRKAGKAIDPVPLIT